MLTDPLRRELQTLIQRFIGAGPSWDAIHELVGAEAVDGLPGGMTPAAAARWIIGVGLAQADPDRMVSIVEKVNLAGESPELAAWAQRLRAEPTGWAGAGVEDLWVPVSWPFTDRDDLRSVLGQLARAEGPPVVTIEAPPGHGKRTICAYIELVARRAGALQPVVRTLQPDPEPGLLDAVVADLRLALRLPIARPTTHAEPEREAAVLARELAREAAFASTSAWFAANLPGAAGLEPGVLRFVDELAGLLAAGPESARHLRMTLLADDVASLGLTSPPPPEARYVLPEVDEASVLAWLTAAVPGKRESLYAVAASTVFASVEQRRPTPSQRLGWLARHCIEAHKQLLGEAG